MSLPIGFNAQLLPAFGNHWKRFLTLGMILLFLGLFAISASTFSTLLTVDIIGFILFFSGAILLFDAFSFWWKKGTGFFLHLLFAALYLVAGVFLIKNPVISSITFTFMLGLFYVIAGTSRVILMAFLRSPQWGWSWLNGIINLLLGILILASWPASSLYIIGLFVGIDLVFVGWAYIMAALAAKKSLV